MTVAADCFGHSTFVCSVDLEQPTDLVGSC